MKIGIKGIQLVILYPAKNVDNENVIYSININCIGHIWW